MADSNPIVDFSLFDMNRVVADKDEIERNIPQRFEMSQLDGIVFEDPEGLRIVGYKNTSRDDFWVRGHMPEFALMPGVIMCESAAQVIAYMARKFNFADDGIMAFGGMDRVKFRNMVLPGDQLVTMVIARKLRKNALVVCDFQSFVGDKLIVDGVIKGVVLRPEMASGE